MEYKELWRYICETCDHAGIWYVDFELAGYMVGAKFNEDDAKMFFSKQITMLDSRWHIKDFPNFQYGPLNPNNNLHRSVIAILKKHNLPYISAPAQPLVSPTPGAKEKDKDKEDVKQLVKKQEEWFEKIWPEFPAKGRIRKKEAFRRFCASVPDAATATRCVQALERYLASKRVVDGFVQNAPTWFGDWTSWENYEEPNGPPNR